MVRGVMDDESKIRACGEEIEARGIPRSLGGMSGRGGVRSEVAPTVLRTRIGMSADAWFDWVGTLGPVTLAAHNSMSAVGWYGPFPEVGPRPLRALPRSATHHYSPNLSEFVHLWVVRRREEGGWQHILEVEDGSGEIFQRVVVHSADGRRGLSEAVARFRRDDATAAGWFPLNHVESVRRRRSVTSRIPWLRRSEADGSNDVRRLPKSALELVLNQAVAAGQRLRTMLYHPALVCGGAWVPEVSAPSNDGVVRYYGGSFGVEIEVRRVRSVWLWKDLCACCGRTRWAIEVGGRGDRLCLALMSVNEGAETEWRRFLVEGVGL